MAKLLIRNLILVTVLLSPAVQLRTQPFTLPQMIESWQVSDTSQSHRADIFAMHVYLHKDTVWYDKIMEDLSDYIRLNKDPRVEVRAILFEIWGACLTRTRDKAFFDRYIPLVQKALFTATALQDEQLIADVYVVYSVLESNSDYAVLLYNLKTISINERIGLEHFNSTHGRFFAISSTLYHTQDFRQSIRYGRRFFDVAKREGAETAACMYQLDVLGSAYRKLGMFDSSAFFYQKLADTARTLPESSWQRIWVSIGLGNVGYSLALQGRYEEAFPLIYGYVEESEAFKEPLNRGISLYELGDLYFRWGKYKQALTTWSRAYPFSVLANDIPTSMQVAKELNSLYRQMGNTDSAFYYNNLYHIHKDTLAAISERGRLATISAKVAYDELQRSLLQAQHTISKEQSRRNYLFMGSGLVMLIGVFAIYYYKKRTRQRLNGIEEELALTADEANRAREKTEMQKTMILELQTTLSKAKQSNSLAGISEKLSRYSLATDAEWEQFRSEFVKSCPGFMSKLYARLPQPTAAEERLIILICLWLNNAQIASMLGISADSVARSKHRLKQKLDMSENTKLDEYLIGYFGLLTA